MEMSNVDPPPPLPPPKAKRQAKRPTEKHLTKQANLMACNAAAKNPFAQSDAVKKLEQEIARLRQELHEEQVHISYEH